MKVVEGFQIKRIEHDTPSFVGGAILHGYDIRFDRKLQVLVLQSYIEKHAPLVGGYFVRYEDGYESFSQAAAFEGGYTPIRRRRLVVGPYPDMAAPVSNGAS